MMADEDSLPEGSYSQLLFADDDVDSLNTIDFFNFSSLFSSENSQKILCFGDFAEGNEGNDLQLVQNDTQNSSLTCSTSNPFPFSSDNNIKKNPSKSKKKRNGPFKETRMEEKTGEIQKSMSKKAKAETETSISKGHSKVKKENLGGRITALQQIVSPFGKADTATVLQEAKGYIKFLHDQVQENQEKMQIKPERDLRSRGLCLVPVELTSQVLTGNNGADLWSPAMVNYVSQN